MDKVGGCTRRCLASRDVKTHNDGLEQVRPKLIKAVKELVPVNVLAHVRSLCAVGSREYCSYSSSNVMTSASRAVILLHLGMRVWRVAYAGI